MQLYSNQPHDLPYPHLTTANCRPLNHLESTILQHIAPIEGWFRKKWQQYSAPITSSVDLRNAGYKLAPVDTNLFPAGFNNLNPDFLPMCVQAIQSTIVEMMPTCTNILLIPEAHTRNTHYLQSLYVLKTILLQAGFVVRIGQADPSMTTPIILETAEGQLLRIEPIRREGQSIVLEDFKPCLVLLNNDLSSGVPPLLEGIDQKTRPLLQLGWSNRLKSTHFGFYQHVANEFCELLGLDSWLISPLFGTQSGIDFMAQEGLDALADEVDNLLQQIKARYLQYDINEKPFVVVKSDNGTYGMSVMMVHDGDQIRNLNRKMRTKMASGKGQQKVNRVMIQEGVHTFETMEDLAVAEPVVYMIGSYVVGGFYRVHQGRGVDENLNAPGMHFVPLAFAKPCNTPEAELSHEACPNRFYVYGVIARLAALAAAYEHHAVGGTR